MKKHYETHVEDTDKLISVAGPVLDYKSWYERYRKLMEEQAQRKYGLYTPTSEGDDDFPSIPGITARYSALGLTNEQMAENPVWVDKTGNGHDLQMKNFTWSGMSGCGGYSVSKEIFSYTPDIYSLNFIEPGKGIKEFDVYFQLIDFDENSGVSFNLDIRESGTSKIIKRETYTKDGIYHFEYKSEDDATNLYMVGYNGVGEGRTTFTVKILPYYAGALVFDGVDDYGTCDNFPILTKEKGYTVVALRQWIEEKNDSTALVSNCKNWNQDGAFLFEYNDLRINFLNVVISFGHVSSVDRGKSPFSYQTSKLYNGKNIKPGSFIGSNELVVGKGNKDFPTVSKVAIWELIILDHDATEEELTKIKNYFIKTYPWLFFDQAWTVTGKTNEDEDRATIANITGNGNNLVLSNFGFAGNSGYGEYAYNWNTWKINKVDSTKSNVYHNRMEITLPAIGESSKTQCNFYSPLCKVGTIYDFSFKISGLTGNSVVLVRPGTNGEGAIIAQYNKDGVYHLNYTLTDEAIVGESTQNRIYFFIQNFSDEEMNLTIEQIPDHEGYLVTDGVDDEVKSSSFSMAKDFTVVGEWELLDKDTRQSGLTKFASFFIYSRGNMLAFYCKDGSKPELLNLKSIVAFNSKGVAYDNKWQEYTNNVVGNDPTYNSRFYLGYGNNNYSKVAFKNLATYVGRILSKEDDIKAYIYLQTLKAK